MKATRFTLMLLFLSSSAPAQQRPDFSGLYMLKPPWVGKHEKAPPPGYLRVTQTDKTLDAKFSQGDKAWTARYYLDGSPSDNLIEGGYRSKDTARLKRKTLAIESTVPLPHTVLHMRQQWQLSRDAQTLTIRLAAEGTIMGHPLGLPSGNEVYTRQP
jgi:hypothetical protein